MSEGTPFANVLFIARKNQDNPNQAADERR